MENAAEKKVYAVVKVYDYEISVPMIFEEYYEALAFCYIHERDPASYGIYETVMRSRFKHTS